MRLTTICFALICVACGTEIETTAPSYDNPRADRPASNRDLVTDVACGDLITADVRLEADLTCPSDALFVAADGVKINLNGHAIVGSGTGIGITLRGRTDVTIYGGTVRNFVTGIFVNTSMGVVIKDNAFTQTREAVFLAGSSGNVLKSNVAWQNTLRGFMIRPTGTGVPSTDNTVVDNILTDNPSGILVFGQSGNRLKGNTISGSSVGAIDLTGGGGTGTLIKENLLSTSAAGIKFGPGWNSGNFIIGNAIQLNTCGLAGPSAANEFKDNVFSSNTTDICP